MLNQRTKAKLNLSNPYLFWGLVIALLMGTFLAIIFFTFKAPIENKSSSSIIVEQSHHEEKQPEIIIDPDNLHYMDIEKNMNQAGKTTFSSSATMKLNENILFLLLLLYTIILVFLIIYHIKQKRSKQILERKIEDEIQVLKIREEAHNQIYDGMWDDIEKYQPVFEPELNIKALKQQLSPNSECCIADGIIVIARKVLEKVLTPLHREAFPHSKGSSTLNDIIYHLNKKEVISKAMHNYARTIQSFGNMAAHADISKTNSYELKEATSVINSLVLLLKELDAAKLLKA